MTRLLKIFISFIIIMFTYSAHAEYYVVYTAPPCGYACYERPHRVSYHKKQVKKHKTYKPKRKYKRHYYYEECRVATYYAWYPVSSCGGGCERAWAPARRDYYKDPTFTTPSDDAYYYHYDPDLSTGDDDATVNPNMDIDY